VGPKHVEIRQYINKIEIVTSVGFYSICLKDARYKKLKICTLLNLVCALQKTFVPEMDKSQHHYAGIDWRLLCLLRTNHNEG